MSSSAASLISMDSKSSWPDVIKDVEWPATGVRYSFRDRYLSPDKLSLWLHKTFGKGNAKYVVRIYGFTYSCQYIVHCMFKHFSLSTALTFGWTTMHSIQTHHYIQSCSVCSFKRRGSGGFRVSVENGEPFLISVLKVVGICGYERKRMVFSTILTFSPSGVGDSDTTAIIM